MDQQQLRADLERLRSEIEQTQVTDPVDREELRRLVRDVEDLLARSGDQPSIHDETLNQRLDDAVRRFEVTYPTLTTVIAKVLNTLSGAGI